MCIRDRTPPNPGRNRAIMAGLPRPLRLPWPPPTPRPLVHAGAVLLRTDPALALSGRRCIPQVLDDAGFKFEHDEFAAALDHLLTPGGADSG